MLISSGRPCRHIEMVARRDSVDAVDDCYERRASRGCHSPAGTSAAFFSDKPLQRSISEGWPEAVHSGLSDALSRASVVSSSI